MEKRFLYHATDMNFAEKVIWHFLSHMQDKKFHIFFNFMALLLKKYNINNRFSNHTIETIE